MVNSPAYLDSVFAALSDPIRRGILHGLAGGSVPVGTLAKPFRVSAPAISRHLRVLEGAGLIRRAKRGRIHEIELTAEPLHQAADWLDTYRRHWESSLDRMARYLESESPPSSTPEPVSDPFIPKKQNKPKPRKKP